MRTLLQVVSFALWAACLVVTWATGVVNGVAVLMVLFLVVFLWSCGAFSRAFWVADDVTSERLTVVDEQVRFIESVRATAARLESRE